MAGKSSAGARSARQTWAAETTVFFAVVASLSWLVPAAQAQTAPTVTVYIGTTTGGGYDLYSRLAARHLGRFLPGNPNVLPSNMPGAGAVIMANWLYNIAPKDGTAIGLVPSTTAFDGLFGNTSAQYDATKFNWVGSLDNYTTVAVVWGQTPYTTAEDLLTKPIVVGGGGAASDVTVWPKLVNSLLGAKLQIVNGYVGTSSINLAMERGEVQGMVGDDWDALKLVKPDWLRESKIRVLMQFVSQRIPELPDVATPLDFMTDERGREVMSLFLQRQHYGRPFAAPPGTAPEKVAALRQAFAAMSKDPDFLADAAKTGAVIDFASGEDIQAMARRIYTAPKEILARATDELQKASH